MHWSFFVPTFGGKMTVGVRLQLKLDAISQLLTIERDPFSWLLSRLTTECAKETHAHSWLQCSRELKRADADRRTPSV